MKSALGSQNDNPLPVSMSITVIVLTLRQSNRLPPRDTDGCYPPSVETCFLQLPKGMCFGQPGVSARDRCRIYWSVVENKGAGEGL